MTEERRLYNPNDGLTGRGGGPYLDLEEDRLAEERRARIEGREPDLENPPASGGTVLVTAGQLLANQGVNNLPSVSDSIASDQEAAVKSLADNEETALKARAVLPGDAFTPPSDEVDTSMRSALMTDGSVPEGESNLEPQDNEPEADNPFPEDNPEAPAQENASDAADDRSTDSSEDPSGTFPTAK